MASAENKPLSVALYSCQVLIAEPEVFIRGDCNFSREENSAVNIADAVAVVDFIFLPQLLKVDIGCLDACDCNDDGRVDLADSMCILLFLFVTGTPPPPPSAGMSVRPGPDPTPDRLDCEAGRFCES